MTTEKTAELQEIGRNAYAAIKEMVDALQLDWERLEELKEQRDDWGDDDGTWYTDTDERDELEELLKLAGDCEDEDDARQRIDEDPLSLQVRADWREPGSDDNEPVEFCLLLTTGGPAVRIIGELSNFEPTHATLQVQDWGTPWTDYTDADQDVLLAYAKCFYFGE